MHRRPTPLARKACRFALSGLLVTGLHVIISIAFIKFVLPVPSVANGMAFIVATVFSYLINTLWSFSSPLHGKNLLRFVLVSLVGFFLAVTVAGAAQYYGMPYWYGIGLVACTVPPITFVLHTFWTYR